MEVGLLIIHVSYEMKQAVTDFGVYDPIFADDIPGDRLSTYPLDADHEPHDCSCNVCQQKAHPFFALPGEMPADSTRPWTPNRKQVARTGNDGVYPDNIIYLFGRD